MLEANERAAPLDVPEVSEVVDHHHQPKFLISSRFFWFNPFVAILMIMMIMDHDDPGAGSVKPQLSRLQKIGVTYQEFALR